MTLPTTLVPTLVLLTALASGCSQTQTLTADMNLEKTFLTDEFLDASNEVKRNFRYKSLDKFMWPPEVDVFGNVLGNCMTYSRVMARKLSELGYSVRFRNVLTTEKRTAHVVTVATDTYGNDWVFDNVQERPFPLHDLYTLYERETRTQSAQIGAQRRQWVAVSGFATAPSH